MKITLPSFFTLSIISCFLLVSFSTNLAMAKKQRYTRTVEEYTIPNLSLTNQDGEKILLKDYLDREKPIILEFVFATCTTICPILSIGFSNLQHDLGQEAADKVQLVSISIDPEHDTPKVLKAYLKRYKAQPGWDFFTGKVRDIKKIMQAFDADVSDKMGHRPLTFLLSAKDKKWVRIDGLMSGKELKKEYLQISK